MARHTGGSATATHHCAFAPVQPPLRHLGLWGRSLSGRSLVVENMSGHVWPGHPVGLLRATTCMTGL
jgi:hypothetical protein